MSIRIAIIVEGGTEKAFVPVLRRFLESHLKDEMPKLTALPQNGRVPKGDKLKRMVQRLLSGREPCDHVIALTDVYTGTQDFSDGADAIDKMREWVGTEPRFHPHAAQHDFEAWLLPYWDKIRTLARTSMAQPNGKAEEVDHGNPPSRRIQQAYINGRKGRAYKKTIDAAKILEGEDLQRAIDACPHLKALMNTIVHTICGKPPVP